MGFEQQKQHNFKLFKRINICFAKEMFCQKNGGVNLPRNLRGRISQFTPSPLYGLKSKRLWILNLVLQLLGSANLLVNKSFSNTNILFNSFSNTNILFNSFSNTNILFNSFSNTNILFFVLNEKRNLKACFNLLFFYLL